MRPGSALLGIIFALGLVSAARADAVRIPGGEFAPVIAPAPGTKTVYVRPFRMDQFPVTNAEFLQFVADHGRWRRERIAALYADQEYLSHWAGAASLGAHALAGQPVTRVSWYAARAYCEARGARLPTWNEWEYVAAASATEADARQNPHWRATILDWYSKPAAGALATVGMSPGNIYGINDMHGLIWEWVDDFNALMLSADSRDQGDPDKRAFCGSGALSAEDRENYPILMRLAFLSALQGRSTARTLGFRCAETIDP